MTTYTHADFVGNPHKNGIINITDAPYLPIRQRNKAEQVNKTKPIAAPDSKWRTDTRYLSLIHSTKDLTAAQREEVERQLLSIGVELSTPDANSLQMRAAITGVWTYKSL